MEIFSAEFFTALFTLVMIDLVLAGDNAIVIGLAARNVPKHQQKVVILWGTLGAIVVRVLATLAVVWLLNMPGLRLGGGLLLIWIARNLLKEEKCHDDICASDNRLAAIRNIIVADGIMGLDNVLGVAGAAHGNFLLVILGLAISVPVVVWGSTIFIKLTERFPVIITLGAAVLGWTAASMLMEEPLVVGYFEAQPVLKLVVVLVVALLLFSGKLVQWYSSLKSQEASAGVAEENVPE